MSATIAARAHSNATLSAPARRGQPARRKAPWLTRLARMAARRPGRSLVLLLFAGVAVAILVNALMFQKVRHPAPMVSAPTSTPTARSAERRAEPPAATAALAPAPLAATSAPMPPARPNDLPQSAREAAPRPPAAVTTIPRTAAVPAPAAPVARSAPPRDPIADLINGGDLRPPGEIRGVAAAKPATPRRTVEN